MKMCCDLIYNMNKNKQKIYTCMDFIIFVVDGYIDKRRIHGIACRNSDVKMTSYRGEDVIDRFRLYIYRCTDAGTLGSNCSVAATSQSRFFLLRK